MTSLEYRMAAVEQELMQVKDRLTMEEGLAASRDRDISDIKVTLRSHTSMIQALQERQAEQGETLKQLVGGQQELQAGQQELRAGQQAIVGLLTQLIEREEQGPPTL